MKTFPGFLLIFAVLWSGESLICEVCNRDGLKCSGQNETCKAQLQTCAVVLVESTNWGKPRLRTVKTCERRYNCDTPVQSLNMGRGRYERSSVFCCIGEACKKSPPRFSPGFVQPNGRECPACFATQLSLCGSAKVDCSGKEIYCISTYQTIPVGNVKF
nr:PREDICTED: phospholipase A2 inhibitor and Ly6/PLAUR domain-containing protein [Anolis carolinensis]XP_008111989.1 PREDICTED: phospholipase A2 inhibitor and Ly6/PLAUR domain-containing protein [Anolis carolinensis]|eukprot:XP_008111988.1 PREDICTED: phospholipase A2 inhibitor and Ly6/PLAUR domain-containing protein [Anolis carolinensis]